MMDILFSEFESKYFDLKIGRAKAKDASDFPHIGQAAKQLRYDIVRVESPILVEEPGFTYIRSINDYKHTYKTSNNLIDLRVEKIVTNEQAEWFEQAIVESYLGNSLDYVKNPNVKALYPKINELSEAQCYASYYRTFFTPSNDTKGTLIFYNQTEFVGGYNYEVIGNGVYTSIALVLNKYRRSGYFKQFHDFRENFFFDKRVKYGFHGGRADNLDVNKFYLKEGYEVIGQRHIYVLGCNF